MSECIPVALFAYSRPELLQLTLSCLRRNNVPLIYAFSDAPRTPDKASRVSQAREILRAVDWCKVVMVERESNLGLGRSILGGVAEVLRRHETAIVVEDDLILVDGAYAYLAAALEHYRDDSRVMSVTGWTHPRITPADLDGAPYFDGRAECLVWGTWRRVWKGMGNDALALIRRCEAQGIDPYCYGADLVEMARIEHERNIWAVRFLYWHILNGGLCLRPAQSLVEHAGSGPDATNASDFSGWANGPLNPCPPIPTHWPPAIEHPDCRTLAREAYGSKPPEQRFATRVRAQVRRTVPPAFISAYRRMKKQLVEGSS